MRLNAISRALGACFILLLAAVPALAQPSISLAPPTYKGMNGVTLPMTPVAGLGRDSVTGSICWVGITATCQVPGAGGGGGGGSLSAVANTTAPTATDGANVALSTDLGVNLRVIDAQLHTDMQTMISAVGTPLPAQTTPGVRVGGVEGVSAPGVTPLDYPLYGGCRAATTIPTAVTDGTKVAQMCTKSGRTVTEPFAPRELRSASPLLTLSTATETTLQAAGGAGVFLDMVQIKVCNTSATDVRLDVRDATGGAVVDSWYVQAGRCVGQTYNAPISQTTANSNWTVQSSAAVTDLRVKAAFVQAK